MGTKHDEMVDEEVATTEGQQQANDEAQQILDGFAQALVNLESSRGAFIGTPSQENLAEYLACLERVVELHDSIDAIQGAVRVSNTMDSLGVSLINAAHTAAYKRMFPHGAERSDD